MRFIGNKTNLTDQLHEAIDSAGAISGERFFDFFAGTGSVGKFFREKGFHVESADVLYFSYVLQQAYIATDESKVKFKGLNSVADGYEKIVQYLNDLPGLKGFIYSNFTEEGTGEFGSKYTRKYFTGENGKRIDAIRSKIEEWHNAGLITDTEFFWLVATVIESVPFYANVSGVYAAFLKWYDPRSLKRLELRPIERTSGPAGLAIHANSMDLLGQLETDILYLDPPYNARQYAPNYHLLETIALYDRPELRGVTGMRPYGHQKSEFCNPTTGLKALAEIASRAKYSTLALSYNSEGIMPSERILEVLGKHGHVQLAEFNYRRFRSNSNGSNHKVVREQLYILQKSKKKNMVYSQRGPAAEVVV